MKKKFTIGTIFIFCFSSIMPLVIGNDNWIIDRELTEYPREYHEIYDFHRYQVFESCYNEKQFYMYNTNNEYKSKTSIILSEAINTLLIDAEYKEISQTTGSGPMDSAWPMFGHDSRRMGRSPYGQSGNIGLMKWRTPWIGQTVSSPAIADDGTIYLGSMPNTYPAGLYAINPNGSIKWKFDTDWIYSSPSIYEDGIIYFGCFDGKLYAVNPNGTLRWKFNCHDIVMSSPVINKDGVIIIGVTGPWNEGRIYCLNPNGTEKWYYDTADWIYSSPALDENGNIYIGSHDGNLYALNPNGTLKWKFDTNDEVKSVPTIGDDGTIYVGSWNGKLYSINPNGTLQWEFQTGESIDSSPTIASDGTIYIGSYNGLIFSISSDGTENWRYQTNNWILSSAAIDKYGVIYFGSMDGYLYVFNPDGSLKWKYRGSGGIEASPAIAEDGTIYIGSGNYLHAIEVIDDQPPGAPYIEGPPSGETGIAYYYTFNAIDPDGDNVKYIVNWGDSNTDTTDLNPSGKDVTINHTWNTEGTYIITANAQDEYGINGPDSTLQVTITLGNQPPDKPTIDGATSGKAGVEYTYTAYTIDLDGENISFWFDWGDGSNSDWTEYVLSGEIVNVSHIWTERGTYNVKVKAKDIYGHESDWSDPLFVSMPKNKVIISPFIHFLKNHPLMFPILRQLLRL